MFLGTHTPRLDEKGRLFLPAKFRIRFLPPVPTDAMGDEPWQDKGLVQTVADEVRDTIQEHVLDMVARRTSVWF